MLVNNTRVQKCASYGYGLPKLMCRRIRSDKIRHEDVLAKVRETSAEGREIKMV